MACRNQSPRPYNLSLYAFPLPSCYHHLFNPWCLCSPPFFPGSLSNPAAFTRHQMTIIVEATWDSISQKSGSRAFGTGCVRSGKEIMYKKQPSVVFTAVPESALENGITPCSWPVPPASCPSEHPAGGAQTCAERASELQD